MAVDHAGDPCHDENGYSHQHPGGTTGNAECGHPVTSVVVMNVSRGGGRLRSGPPT
jgi:hypothetical protein